MTKFFSKKTFIFILVFTLFLGLFFVNVRAAKAMNPFASALQGLIKGVFWIILKLTSFFTGLIAKLFTAILNLGFEDMRAVHLGWTISRDIVNMFFILGLIVIAFATILRIESYGMKTLLAKLLIAALFINFSYLACGIIIDSSQVISNYFICQINGGGQCETKGDTGMSLLAALKVSSSLTPSSSTPSSSAEEEDTNANWIAVLNYAFSAVIIGVAGFALFVGCVLLFIRMGTLWALMILVPFAWFFNVFPGLNQHFKKWWSEFIKWTFFAPIYVFFIYLILTIAVETEKFVTDAKPMGTTPSSYEGLSLTGAMNNWNLVFYYILLVILLYGAVPLALSMGGKAASIGMGLAKGVLKGAYKLPGQLRASMVAPPGWLKALMGEKLSKKLSTLAIYTTPAFLKEAYQERKKELQRGAGVSYAKGKMHDIMNRVLSIGKERTSHAEEAQQFEVDEESKKVGLETNREGARLITTLQGAVKSGSGGKIRGSAALKLLFDQNDHNDLLLSDEFSNWTWTDKSDYARENDLVGKAYGKETNSAALKDLLFQAFEKMGMSESDAAPLVNNFSQVALASGNYSAYHMTETDEKTGKRKRSSDKDQMLTAATKYATTNMREKARKQHPTSTIKQGWDPVRRKYIYKGIDPAAIELIRNMPMAEILKTRLEESRPDRIELESQATVEDVEGAIKKRDAQEEKTAIAENRKAVLLSEEDKTKFRTYFNRIREFAAQEETEGTKKKPKKKTTKTPEAEGPSEAEKAEHRKKAGYE